MSKILHPLLGSLNVYKTVEEINDELKELMESYDPEEKEELKEEIKDLKITLNHMREELDGYIKHFKGFFYVDQLLNSPMSEFYNDMEDMAKDVVKTLEQLKLEL